MKRYLNLNDISGRVILVIAVLGVGVPGALFLVSLGLNSLGIHWPALRILIWGSCAAGGIICLAFLALIIVELIQDEVLYKKYLRGRGKRIRAGQGNYECPYCGNRNIKEFESQCRVCGRELDS